MKYRIVSDSSSNVYTFDSTVEYTTVPLKIRCDEREFVDEKNIDIPTLLQAMADSESSSTSCPNAQEWEDAFEGADVIFAITISSQLSGSYSTAVMARDSFLEKHPEAKVYVIDSLATGGSMELITEKLVEQINLGVDPDEIMASIHEYMNHTHILFLLESLQNLAKNGRLNPTIAKIAGLLGIRFLGKGSEKGTIQQAHVAKGAKRSMQALYNEILKLGYQGGKMRISHCMNPDATNALIAMLKEKFPLSDITYNLCGGLCSYYAEKGGMIVCFEDIAK